jgi:hypothetical protein
MRTQNTRVRRTPACTKHPRAQNTRVYRTPTWTGCPQIRDASVERTLTWTGRLRIQKARLHRTLANSGFSRKPDDSVHWPFAYAERPRTQGIRSTGRSCTPDTRHTASGSRYTGRSSTPERKETQVQHTFKNAVCPNKSIQHKDIRVCTQAARMHRTLTYTGRLRTLDPRKHRYNNGKFTDGRMYTATGKCGFRDRYQTGRALMPGFTNTEGFMNTGGSRTLCKIYS